MTRKYVILDRDGTLIHHVHHLSSIKQVKLFEDSIIALSKLSNLGFRFGIITNQSIINRGIATVREVDSINDFIVNSLAKENIHFDFVLMCPHRPEDECRCRKPKTLLGELAMCEFGIDSESSFMVGDQVLDLEFGSRLGMASVGVRNVELKSLESYMYFHNLSVFSDWVELERGT